VVAGDVVIITIHLVDLVAQVAVAPATVAVAAIVQWVITVQPDKDSRADMDGTVVEPLTTVIAEQYMQVAVVVVLENRVIIVKVQIL
jgi:hypothetical protein